MVLKMLVQNFHGGPRVVDGERGNSERYLKWCVWGGGDRSQMGWVKTEIVLREDEIWKVSHPPPHPHKNF